MKSYNPFSVKGDWYKGNLHTHTTISDGPFSPKETVDYYRDRNYQFICISDHEKVTDISKLGGKDFLVLSGAEYGGKTKNLDGFHVLGIDTKKRSRLTEKKKDESIINWLKTRDYATIIAHPYASMTKESLFELKDYWGIEVFSAYFYFRQRELAYSTVFWDELLKKGRRIWGFACDDGHGFVDNAPEKGVYFSEKTPEDLAFAWIMVKSPSLSLESIMHSIKKGYFYASYGPSILSLEIDNCKCQGETSLIKEVTLISDKYRKKVKHNSLFSHYSFSLQGEEKYVRLECEDFANRKAWSNPIFLN